MALPKGKISKARKHSRRANWKLTVPGIVECPQCHQMKLAQVQQGHPHRAQDRKWQEDPRVQALRFLQGRAGRCGQRGKERLIGIRGQKMGELGAHEGNLCFA